MVLSGFLGFQQVLRVCRLLQCLGGIRDDRKISVPGPRLTTLSFLLPAVQGQLATAPPLLDESPFVRFGFSRSMLP